MTKLSLSFSCGDYELLRPLLDGEVQMEGIQLITTRLSSPERHWRMLRHREFDVSELSLSSYLVARERKEPVTALPVFPHRRFRHSSLYCPAVRPLTHPKQLEGARVGLRTYQTTAGVWLRGILQDEYGVDLTSIRWIGEHEEDLPFTPPPSVRLELAAPGTTINGLLESGQLEAAIYPETLPGLATGTVQTLFADPKAEEQKYFRKTHIFPIMHAVVIRDEILQQHPWVARNLFEGFQAAKAVCYQRAQDPRRYPLAWVGEALEEQRVLLGPDPWRYGLGENRAALETMIRYSFEQGLLRSRLPLDTLFPASLSEVLPRYSTSRI
ncbi:MAG: ABC transporter substrate-binding protein [Acidobacteria bacterium]|nr:ABC transporter substrate-binding protein [Acidobacteriota bacterium]